MSRIDVEPPLPERSGTPEMVSIESEKEMKEAYTAYFSDESRMPGGRAECIVFPYSEKQVADFFQENAEYKRHKPVTLSAARTGITGGAVPMGGILLSLERMDHILGVRWDGEREAFCIRMEPGVTLQALNDALSGKTFDFPMENMDEDEKTLTKRFLNESDHWYYPIDPTEKSAHIGGTVVTNASGARSFHYGQTRAHVTAIRVVLSWGEVLHIPRGRFLDTDGLGFKVVLKHGEIPLDAPEWKMPQIKNAAGYYADEPMDIINYFIGSEGTLGVITEVEVRLTRKPLFTLAGIAYFEDGAQAVQFVKKARELKKNGHQWVNPAALEYFDAHSLKLLREKRNSEGAESDIPPFPESAAAAIYFEQNSSEEDVEAHYMAYDELLTELGTSMDQTWGGMEPKELEQMALFRHALPETINSIIGQRQAKVPRLHKVGTDFTVPDEGLDEMMAFYRERLDSGSFEYAIFGHIGENHLHVNILPRDEDELEKAKALYRTFAEKAVSLGGSVSGEHGLGKLKKAMLQVMYSPESIQAMKKLKSALDPQGILNQGNIF